jgi:hypothetical protein
VRSAGTLRAQATMHEWPYHQGAFEVALVTLQSTEVARGQEPASKARFEIKYSAKLNFLTLKRKTREIMPIFSINTVHVHLATIW